MDLPTIDMIQTGKSINRLRKQANLSVKDLQNIFGFATPQAIYKWQQGAALPSIDNLVVLAAVPHSASLHMKIYPACKGVVIIVDYTRSSA